MAMVTPGNLVSNMSSCFADRSSMDEIGCTVSFGECFAELVSNEIFAVGMLPDKLSWVVRPDGGHFRGNGCECFLPADLDPLGVFSWSFIGIGPL